jgi:hypothetical protein
MAGEPDQAMAEPIGARLRCVDVGLGSRGDFARRSAKTALPLKADYSRALVSLSNCP